MQKQDYFWISKDNHRNKEFQLFNGKIMKEKIKYGDWSSKEKELISFDPL
jgi:hypothetical protein